LWVASATTPIQPTATQGIYCINQASFLLDYRTISFLAEIKYLLHILEDLALVPGIGEFSNTNNFLLRCLIIKHKTGYKRKLNEDFKTGLVSTIS